MKCLPLLLLSIAAVPLVCRAETPLPTFKKIVLADKFYCEGANVGDFNNDGKLDVVAGPWWFEGPDFTKKHEIYTPQPIDPHGYSNNFLTFTGDFNGDGWLDVLQVPHPGTDAFWYENPGPKGGPWKKHLALHDCGNESPAWVDVNVDGRPELVYNTSVASGGQLGYATWNPKRSDDLWKFHPITPKNGRFQRYTHGVGVGDINGDGRMDIVEAQGWWEQPANAKLGQPWKFHRFKFAEAGAQMAVYDIDGDGLNDVITSWHCHLYGLVWYQQQRSASGEITWKQHVIQPPQPDLKAEALRISQMHSLDLADMNGDGLKDIVTGKRYSAHGPAGDVEPDAPAVLYWFELHRDKTAPRRKSSEVQFIPHKIDDNSGVGTQVIARDLNGDGVPDIVVGNKKGIFVFLSEKS